MVGGKETSVSICQQQLSEGAVSLDVVALKGTADVNCQ